MKRSIPQPTKAQRFRQDKLREFCICCHVDGWPGCPAEIHHINDTGRNISQDHTVGLCAWHHRGVSYQPRTELAVKQFGPSLAVSKADFIDHYGTELVLLQKANAIINAS